MTYEIAVKLVKQDATNYMRLPNWPSDVRVRVHRPNNINDIMNTIEHPYLQIESTDDTSPWNPTIADISSNEWNVYNG